MHFGVCCLIIYFYSFLVLYNIKICLLLSVYTSLLLHVGDGGDSLKKNDFIWLVDEVNQVRWVQRSEIAQFQNAKSFIQKLERLLLSFFIWTEFMEASVTTHNERYCLPIDHIKHCKLTLPHWSPDITEVPFSPC